MGRLEFIRCNFCFIFCERSITPVMFVGWAFFSKMGWCGPRVVCVICQIEKYVRYCKMKRTYVLKHNRSSYKYFEIAKCFRWVTDISALDDSSTIHPKFSETRLQIKRKCTKVMICTASHSLASVLSNHNPSSLTSSFPPLPSLPHISSRHTHGLFYCRCLLYPNKRVGRRGTIIIMVGMSKFAEMHAARYRGYDKPRLHMACVTQDRVKPRL